ncbi:MAG: LLM class flavin-dependent oxidoreductase [Anaerolineae bacterium]
MPESRIGLVFVPSNPETTVRIIVDAEQRGVPMIWTITAGVTYDPISVFTVAAARTERIVVGTAIIQGFPRHPVALAMQALALEGFAPGRLRLGVGPSAERVMSGVYGIPSDKPVSRLKEYVTVARALLQDGKVDFDGEFYHVHAALPPGITPPGTPVPISALRPPSYRAAGESADGALSWVTPPAYLRDVALPALREGARQANRPAPPLIAHVPVVLDARRDVVLAAAQKTIGFYANLPHYIRMFNDAGYPVPGNGALPDALVDALVVSGTNEMVEARLRELLASGLDELMVSLVPVADPESERGALADIVAKIASE